MRRYGEPRKRGISYGFRPSVYAILPLDGQLLLTHQQEPEPEIQLPGGGIDPGEPLIAALHREVIEETGWRIGQAQRLGAYRRFTFMPEYRKWAEKVCHIFVARPIRPLGPPAETGHTALWADPLVAAEAVASPGDRAFVRRWLGGEFSR